MLLAWTRAVACGVGGTGGTPKLPLGWDEVSSAAVLVVVLDMLARLGLDHVVLAYTDSKGDCYSPRCDCESSMGCNRRLGRSNSSG